MKSKQDSPQAPRPTNNSDNFAPVPSPPGALAKAESSASSVLSAMVADTLALAKREPPATSVFSVLTCIVFGTNFLLSGASQNAEPRLTRQVDTHSDASRPRGKRFLQYGPEFC